MSDIRWSDVLTRLIDGDRLSREEARDVLNAFLGGAVPESIVASVMVLLRQRQESVDELLGFALAMSDRMVDVPIGDDVLDTCGTGGDRQGTINVSTAAGLVAAGAGAKVMKHGGRATSSKAGSADVLEHLGVNIGLDGQGVADMVMKTGFGFALATKFHPAMAAVAPVRRALGIPTAFNFLGPLVNPARARCQLVGVFDRRLAPSMAEVLNALGSQHALVVCGADGMDEISVSAPTHVWEVRAGRDVVTSTITPEQFGISRADPEALRGGDAAQNAEIVRDILFGVITDARRDLVMLNAGAALYVSGIADSIAQGVELAKATLESGRAGEFLGQLLAAQP